MLYTRLTFRSELKDEAILPPFKGSTFRGAFGTALKQVVCAMKRQDCRSCLLGSSCVYASFFETKGPIKTQDGKEVAFPPHPFVIEPPLTTKMHFQSGECLDFNLILFGRACDYLPYWIYAFNQMGHSGIGRKINGKRAEFVLKTVLSSQGKIIYSSRDQRLVTDDVISSLVFQEPQGEVKRLTIHLKTPLRVKDQNHLKADLPFSILIRASLRRISSLFSCYGDGNPNLDYHGLVERSRNKSIEIEKSDLQWFDWTRYSNRQEVKMLMGGMMGSVSYKGNLIEFLPLLRLCEEVHLGKQTTFGLGQIGVEVG